MAPLAVTTRTGAAVPLYGRLVALQHQYDRRQVLRQNQPINPAVMAGAI